ncbi:DUF6503 family protein [Psychroserpens sp.]|uniref:DUF6503 family protein n=1 Tax=Psychroserpens sp. TaxID=2020870 RepID=UPI001B017AA3|nr:DUF6503 family protein [Psychroserpens sp.]MBO6606313.1 hypothetical protein [Psychroserpens sp.]MBO6653017.1 hypothetical protein [Psychroserpens sp.]MBO6680956.1 hypothetical protein [Psychroserpens sp.]MBO6750088.1 hypothetical protein [Psychroserpens sp.]MBO6914568.1 hypothetical protein [Psychroserpens sp.]
MKLKVLMLLIAVSLFGCKKDKPQEPVTSIDYANETLDVTTSTYPESITKVFDAHGGIDNWNAFGTLSFTMQKPNGNEVTTTDLKSRNELIDTPTYTMGADRNDMWVTEKDETPYKGNARFYKGLFMYFYAMPFIVGDDGIIYEDVEPLVFEEKSYPGILASYEAGVGASPDDQYIIYYDDATGQMQWLGYTVTFGKDSKSTDFRFIRYNDWQEINGLILPKSIDWYNYEDKQPTEKRNTIEFFDVKLLKDRPNPEMFKTPIGSKIIE